VFRDYLIWEARVEAKKHELMMLIALGSANIDNNGQRREWNSSVKKSFTSYVSLLWGSEPKDISQEDEQLMEFYEDVIKKSKVTVRKTDQGLVATGVPILPKSQRGTIKPEAPAKPELKRSNKKSPRFTGSG